MHFLKYFVFKYKHIVNVISEITEIISTVFLVSKKIFNLERIVQVYNKLKMTTSKLN